MDVDFPAVVNDSSCDLAAPLEGIRDIAIVGRLLGKSPNRLLTLRATDPYLLSDLRESSGPPRDYCSVNSHFQRCEPYSVDHRVFGVVDELAEAHA